MDLNGVTSLAFGSGDPMTLLICPISFCPMSKLVQKPPPSTAAIAIPIAAANNDPGWPSPRFLPRFVFVGLAALALELPVVEADFWTLFIIIIIISIYSSVAKKEKTTRSTHTTAGCCPSACSIPVPYGVVLLNLSLLLTIAGRTDLPFITAAVLGSGHAPAGFAFRGPA